MNTNNKIIEIEKVIKDIDPSGADANLLTLKNFFNSNTDIAEIISYGIKYLPDIGMGNNKNLDNLKNYKQVIVNYFAVLSELSFLSRSIRDLCQDLSIYANGNSIQVDEYYYNLDIKEAVKKALNKNFI